MNAYYNENDEFAAAWLRNLIKAGHIAPGEVDTRSVVDVRPADLTGYSQHHFFAGIGVWSYALRCAGWADGRAIWTGSCPCQPFSGAGKGAGLDDERHLWPAWFKLIEACRPAVIIGEQVSSPASVGPATKSGRRSRVSDALSQETSRQGFDQARQVEGAEEGIAIRSRRLFGLNPSVDRPWPLRGDWPAVQSGWWPDMGQSVAGSDGPEARIRLLEHQSRAARAQQCDWGLGRGPNAQDRPSHHGSAKGEIERLIAMLGGTAEGQDGPAWFDVVQADLERAHYAIGACDTPAASVGAPHIRQRLYWLAHAGSEGDGRGWNDGPGQGSGASPRPSFERPSGLRATGVMVDGIGARLEGYAGNGDGAARWPLASRSVTEASSARLLADADGGYTGPEGLQRGGQHGLLTQDGRPVPLADAADRQLPQPLWRPQGRDGNGPDRANAPTGPVNGIWRDADWLFCRDGKWRPVEPGTFPLAHGITNRVGRLRGYGNAIVAPLAQAFIEAVMEVIP